MNAQDRMKYFADRKRSEREFMAGEVVYLKLKLYRKTYLALKRCSASGLLKQRCPPQRSYLPRGSAPRLARPCPTYNS